MNAPIQAVLVALLAAAGASAADVPFIVIGAHANAPLSYSTIAAPNGEATWKRRIRIAVEGTEKQDLDDLFIDVRLESEAGDEATVDVAFEPARAQTLEPRSEQLIILKGAFPAVGVYKGELRLLWGTAQRSFPLQVSVAAPAAKGELPVSEYGGTGRAVAAVWGARTEVTVRLRNRGSESLDVEPVFAGAARIDKVDNPTKDLGIPGARVISGLSRAIIEPGGVATFPLVIDGLDDAGIFRIEMSFRDKTNRYTPHLVTTTVYRRDSIVYAILAIAFGAGLAFFVRWYVSDGKERLGIRRRLAALLEQLRAFQKQARTEPLVVAAAVFSAEAERRARDARFGAKLDELDEVVRRAEARLLLLFEIGDATRELERIEIASQAASRKVLDEALVIVRIDPGDDAKVQAARDAVAKLALDATRREQAKHLIDEARAQIALQDALNTTPEHVAALLKISALIRDAERALAADDVTRAATLIEDARLRLLHEGIDEMGRIADGAAPPAVAAATWEGVRQKLKIAVLARDPSSRDWQGLSELLKSMHIAYFTAAIEALVAEARRKAKAKDSRAQQLDAIATNLESLVGSDMKKAIGEYMRHREEVMAADPEGQSDGQVTSFDFAKALEVLPLALARPRPLEAAARVGETMRLDRALESSRVWVNVAVFVLAIASGVKALWIDNLAWGGFDSALIAFLWGAGVQATGDTFTGIIALRNKLAGVT